VSGRPRVPREEEGHLAGTAHGWLPARGLGMATFAIPLFRRHPADARWRFCTKADTICSCAATESFCLWITFCAALYMVDTVLWISVSMLVMVLVRRIRQRCHWLRRSDNYWFCACG
jgi:hypothetical protein